MKIFIKKRKSNRNIYYIVTKRTYVLIGITIIVFLSVIFRLFQLQILNNNIYREKLMAATETIITGNSAPRGRIYDRNYNLIVDNQAIKTIYYKKEKNIKTSEEIELAYLIGDILDIDYNKLSDSILREFWYVSNKKEANSKITDAEWKKYDERKLTDNDLKKMMLERIKTEELEAYDEVDKEVAYIYYLMNKGYSYDEKIIKNVNVTEEEYARIAENISNLRGFNTKLDWERIYLYGDVFKSILGRVSSENQGIPAELSEYYLEKGYTLNDRVGISYLEYQYEDYLKGEKATYRLLNDKSYELVTSGKRGNDIILTIDINLQKEVESILSYEVLNAKNDAQTEYYNRSFVIISDPTTGEILAMAGKQILETDNKERSIIDFTPGILTLPVTAGSIVKGASISVGYKYGAIDIGTTMYDECIKIKDTKEKCSWRNLGNVNDITALQLSSNIYQFKIAMKVGGANYVYNGGLKIDESAFDKYREMYAMYGLGVKTGIDLPLESIGYKGTSTMSGHLLDFSIGQYDTYTPIQLAVYINTIANNGDRLQPYLLKSVYAPNETKDDIFGNQIYQANSTFLGHVDLEDKYIERIQEGFHAVMQGSLGYGYMGNYNYSAGKTGTSQSFIDTDGDGVIDTETITSTFGGYAPYKNPKMSIVVVSPDISNGITTYTSGANKRITSQITNKFFEIFK